ncbi:uncharacterized protein BDZ99DRAFT_162847 [Mytilinidion resinicola]|uniref:Uncharacterized protein n=1 Tax=Mytilinidion resinicola TaxID=574789 RepID=A0A6A6Y581_9PEZI|nr:uncharacterized protein BDZ99DRAFT_162847 [Mytilinidion resinicola]KAF2803779.1 hypothetical protein BDZ99DRAFT_162847 [Mytilinidion resinicola]
MPHGITSSNVVRTIISTCDIFVLAIGLLEPRPTAGMNPEQALDAMAPWLIDAEIFWERMFGMAR